MDVKCTQISKLNDSTKLIFFKKLLFRKETQVTISITFYAKYKFIINANNEHSESCYHGVTENTNTLDQ